MAIKRRTNKKRAELTADAIAFLEGRPSFTQFKDDAYLADLWEKHGDTSVATWDEGNSRPRAVADQKNKTPAGGADRGLCNVHDGLECLEAR
jgi:hypothetical protein